MRASRGGCLPAYDSYLALPCLVGLVSLSLLLNALSKTTVALAEWSVATIMNTHALPFSFWPLDLSLC